MTSTMPRPTSMSNTVGKYLSSPMNMQTNAVIWNDITTQTDFKQPWHLCDDAENNNFWNWTLKLTPISKYYISRLNSYKFGF